MNGFERVVLAALMHDLPGLLDRISGKRPSGLDAVLGVARLDDPGLEELIRQAERYAAPAGRHALPVAQTPLLSIFSRLRLRAMEEPPVRYHPLHPLEPTGRTQEALFPADEADLAGIGEYLAVLAQALADMETLFGAGDFGRLYSHVSAVLQRHATCLAAHTSDVALYDHVRLTSAIAACLYRYHEADLGSEDVAVDADQERFALVLGDLSGIQDYIFGITSIGPGGVARRLRARSLQLSVISDSISHQIAHRCQVPLGNVIMASGGRFYVLVPNRGELQETVETLRRDVDEWLRERSNGELAVNLDWVSLSGSSFAASSAGGATGFSDVVTKLNQKLAVRKRRRGASILQDDAAWCEDQFTVDHDYWGRQVCPSCEKFPAQEGSVCQHCQRDADLGRILPQTRYVAYFREHGGHVPLPNGYGFALLREDELEALSGDPYLLIQFNDPDLSHLRRYPAAFRFQATYVPIFSSARDVEAFGQQAFKRRDATSSDYERWGIENDREEAHYPRLRTFAALADAAEGRSLLGYVKADVDHLGLLFAQGLRRQDGPSYDTAPHQAMLSRQMDWFFSGYVQHLLSRDGRYRNFYTIFSGGDDVFLVGPWDRAAGLAREIYERFRAFAGQNPELTLSAGILFTKDRYPISRAAEDAEQALEESKETAWQVGDGNRDQLTVLEDTFRWERAEEIFEEIERLEGWSKQMPSAFLRDLVEYSRLYRLWSEKKSIEGLRYKPLFAYNIARNLRRGDPDLYRWADGLLQSLHAGEPNLAMQHLGLVATYVMFAGRD